MDIFNSDGFKPRTDTALLEDACEPRRKKTIMAA
jgi:hypothetical protein